MSIGQWAKEMGEEKVTKTPSELAERKLQDLVSFTHKLNCNAEDMAELYALAIMCLGQQTSIKKEAIQALLNCGLTKEEIFETMKDNF